MLITNICYKIRANLGLWGRKNISNFAGNFRTESDAPQVLRLPEQENEDENEDVIGRTAGATLARASSALRLSTYWSARNGSAYED